MARPSKRGLCWPTDNKDQVFPFTKPGSKITWLCVRPAAELCYSEVAYRGVINRYNWSPSTTPNATSIEFIPMQWNHVNIDDLPNKARAAGTSTIIGFNEPELPDQSNMTVDLAVSEWLRCVEPMRKAGIRCGSPGISSAPQGVGWLKEFIRRIRESGSDVDFYCLHWYGVDLGSFYDYIWSTHHQLGPDKPVWITEFASTNWNKDNPLPQSHVENFARESVKYLDTLDWVERYAWFGPMRDTGTVGRWARMLDDDGNLTALGKAYRDE